MISYPAVIFRHRRLRTRCPIEAFQPIVFFGTVVSRLRSFS